MRQGWMRRVLVGVVGVCFWFTGAAQGFEGFIGITNGYFFDRATGEAWVPHGIAYQTWNRPLGVWQTDEQIAYDLDEMVKMGANSVRIDMVWQHMEGDGAKSVAEGDNQFDWARLDRFVAACEERGLRIFALIGYQWPPNWFPEEWYTMHPPEWDSEGIWHGERWRSDIIKYEHPEARAQYAEWLGAVAGHFKDSKAIAGWIVGNESGYLGLWSGLLDGYDPETEAAFQEWCEVKYGDIGIPIGSDVMAWSGASAVFEGQYTNIPAPEGTRSFITTCTVWAGWGVYMTNNGSINMSAYAGGHLKFWLQSEGNVEIAVQDALMVQKAVIIPTTTGVWQEVSIPMDSFDTLDLSQIYFLFKATQTGGGAFFVDYVRWQMDPSANAAPVITLPGPHVVLVDSTTNFLVTALDPEGFPVTLVNTVPPEGATFVNGLFTWTAPASACGTTGLLTFVADDLQGSPQSVVTNTTQLVVPSDGDADGLHDGWEWTAFTTLMYGAEADVDGDGASNEQEYHAGTNPQNAGSLFAAQMLREESHPASHARIRIATVPGKTYTIYFSDDRLAPGMSWQPFANSAQGVGTWSETGATEGTFTFVDDQSAGTTGGAPLGGYRTFRVRVQDIP